MGNRVASGYRGPRGINMMSDGVFGGLIGGLGLGKVERRASNSLAGVCGRMDGCGGT